MAIRQPANYCFKCGGEHSPLVPCGPAAHPSEDAFTPDPLAELERRAMGNKPKTVLGTQIGGSHYTDCKIQPIEYIWANGLGFSEGNVVKYITRWRSKGGIKDLEKAKHHIALLIEHAEAEAKSK